MNSALSLLVLEEGDLCPDESCVDQMFYDGSKNCLICDSCGYEEVED